MRHLVLVAFAGCGRIQFAALADATSYASSVLCAAGGPRDGCAGHGYLFCDGFETGTTPWTTMVMENWQNGPVNPGTGLAVVAAPACRGASALHVAGDGRAQLVFLR